MFRKSLALFLPVMCLSLGCSKKDNLAPVPESVVPEGYEQPNYDFTSLQVNRGYFRHISSRTSVGECLLTVEKWLSRERHPVNYGKMIAEGAKLKMYALGGGITAGARDGGLYRQGQLSAYPNLVAKQLGLNDFSTPAFGENESNGIGFDITVPNSIGDFARVTDKLASIVDKKDGSPPKVTPFVGRVDNFAVPFYCGINDGAWSPSMIDRSVNGQTGKSWVVTRPYLDRFIPSGISCQQYLQSRPEYNFFLHETETELFLQAVRTGQAGSLPSYLSGFYHLYDIAKQYADRGIKGVIFTVPRYSDLGLADWQRGGLTDTEIKHFNSAVNKLNVAIRRSVAEHNIALVDLETLYASIHNKTYKTADGLLVHGSTHNGGNFFSSDGFYPTALGQAVIANEVLLRINKTYEVNAPLINIPDYLKTIGASY